VASPTAVDHTDPASLLIVYAADSDTGDIWSMDEAGCHCQLVVNASALSTSDTGPYTLDYCNSVITTVFVLTTVFTA